MSLVSDFEYLSLPVTDQLPRIIYRVQPGSALLRGAMLERVRKAAKVLDCFVVETDLAGLSEELSFASLFEKQKVVVYDYAKVKPSKSLASEKAIQSPTTMEGQLPKKSTKNFSPHTAERKGKQRSARELLADGMDSIGANVADTGYLVIVPDTDPIITRVGSESGEKRVKFAAAWRSAEAVSMLLVEPTITTANVEAFLDYWISTGALGNVKAVERARVLEGMGEACCAGLSPRAAVKEIERLFYSESTTKAQRVKPKREWSSLKEAIRDLVDVPKGQGEREKYALVRDVDRQHLKKMKAPQEIVAGLLKSTREMIAATDARYADHGRPPPAERIAWALFLLSRLHFLLGEEIVLSLDRLCDEYLNIGCYETALTDGERWQTLFGGTSLKAGNPELEEMRTSLVQTLSDQIALVVGADGQPVYPDIICELKHIVAKRS